MPRRGDGWLWAGAFGASIVLHVALASALALAPRPERRETPAATISIQSLTRDVPSSVAPSQVAVADVSTKLAEAASTSTILPPIPQAEDVAAVSASQALAPAQQGEAIAPIREAAPAAAPAAQPEKIHASEPAPTPVVVAGTSQPAVAAPVESLSTSPVDQAEPVSAARVADGIAAETVTAFAADNIVPASASDAVAPSGVSPIETVGAVPPRVGSALPPVAPAPAEGPRVAAAAPILAPASVGAGTASRTEPLRPSQPTASVQTGSERLSAIAADLPPANAEQPAAPVVTGAPISATAPEERIAMAPIRPEAPPIEPRPSVDPLQQVRNVIVAEPGDGGCFVAIAKPSADTVAVDGYAAAGETLARLETDLAAIEDASVAMRRHRIASAQCDALAFTRGLNPDPVPRLTIRPDTPEIASGTELTGVVRDFGRKWLYLVVVDDEGKVQELDDLKPGPDGSIVFRAPLTLTDGPVDTVQLLLAVASDEPLDTFATQDGAPAGAYFQSLREEISAHPRPIDIGMAGFLIR